MSSSENPQHNSVLQALLDLTDLGYGGQSVDSLVKKLQSDRKLATQMQDKWNAHSYPEKSLTFTCLTISDHYMQLTDPQLRVLLFMGMRCHQTWLIQVSMSDLALLTGLKPRATQTAVKGLIGAGCIRVHTPSVRHTPPIYEVNSRLFRKGKPRYQDFNYSACRQDDGGFLLAWPMDYQSATGSTVLRTPDPDGGETVTPYTRITAVRTKKKPADAATSTSPARPKASNHHTKTVSQSAGRHKTGLEAFPDDLPGQMSISDLMRDSGIPDIDDPRLPFN